MKIERKRFCSSDLVAKFFFFEKNCNLPQKIMFATEQCVPYSDLARLRSTVLEITRLMPISTELRVLVRKCSSKQTFKLNGGEFRDCCVKCSGKIVYK